MPGVCPANNIIKPEDREVIWFTDLPGGVEGVGEGGDRLGDVVTAGYFLHTAD